MNACTSSTIDDTNDEDSKHNNVSNLIINEETKHVVLLDDDEHDIDYSVDMVHCVAICSERDDNGSDDEDDFRDRGP